MSNDPAKLLRSAEFKSALASNTPAHLKGAANRIHAHLLTGAILNKENQISLKGTSIFDMGILLMVIEILGDKATTVIMRSIFDSTQLTVKNWIDRLRSDDGMCDIHWEKKEGRVKGNIGKFVVSDWGVLNKEIYLPFKPYVKILVDNLLADIEKR